MIKFRFQKGTKIISYPKFDFELSKCGIEYIDLNTKEYGFVWIKQYANCIEFLKEK